MSGVFYFSKIIHFLTHLKKIGISLFFEKSDKKILVFQKKAKKKMKVQLSVEKFNWKLENLNFFQSLDIIFFSLP